MESIKVPLTRGMFAIVDAEDAERVLAYKWMAAPDKGRRGHVRWYARRHPRKGEGSGLVGLHRFVMNAPRGVEVDHKNGDGLDCRKSNLRFATKSQNCSNRHTPVFTASGYRGVYKSYHKWHVKMIVDGKMRHVGSFATPEEAARVRDRVARDQHGEFATLNFPDD